MDHVNHHPFLSINRSSFSSLFVHVFYCVLLHCICLLFLLLSLCFLAFFHIAAFNHRTLLSFTNLHSCSSVFRSIHIAPFLLMKTLLLTIQQCFCPQIDNVTTALLLKKQQSACLFKQLSSFVFFIVVELMMTHGAICHCGMSLCDYFNFYYVGHWNCYTSKYLDNFFVTGYSIHPTGLIFYQFSFGPTGRVKMYQLASWF